MCVFSLLQTVYRIEKLLEAENWRLYSRVSIMYCIAVTVCSCIECLLIVCFNVRQLNLNWRLSQEQNEHSRLRNYVSCCTVCFVTLHDPPPILQVLLIEFMPKLDLFKPD